MRKNLLRIFSSLFGVFLFVASLWVLHYALKEYRFHDIMAHLKELSRNRILLALLFTALGYLTLIGYDFFALRYINHPLPYRKIAITGFIGYAFSNNVGVSMLTAVRYRLYSVWGLSSVEIMKVVAYCGMAFWLGLFTIGGVIFLLEPFEIPELFHFRFKSLHHLGIIFLVFMAVYLSFSILRKKPIKILKWEFHIPSVRFSLSSIVIACMDLLLNGSVLFVLLPHSENLSFNKLIGIFVLSQVAGLVSQVPGGFGVMDTAIVLLLTPILPVPSVLGSLLAFRAIYYLLPMCLASVLLGIHEFLQKKEMFRLIARIFGQWVPEIVPNVLSFITFIGGATILFSEAIPAEKWRMAWLNTLIPLPIMEISHFLSSLAGILLLILAWGLQRRLNAAYILAVALFIIGIIFSLLKGFNYEEAGILMIMLGVLLPSRQHFYRKTPLINEPLTPGWIVAIVLVILCSVWLGFFLYKHIEYSDELWWRFSLSGDAPRFLRATVGACALVLFFALVRLLRAAMPKHTLPVMTDVNKVRDIVKNSKKTYANFALLEDKSFLFNDRMNAFIMYAISGRSWVALGDPTGPENEMPELVWKFHEMCNRHDGWTVFYEIGRDNLHIYIDIGLTLLKLGEEARVPLTAFSLEGIARRKLRHTRNRLEKEGCTFELIPALAVPPILPELKVISDMWLKGENATDKGFNTGFFGTEYLKNSPIGIVRKDGKIIAFMNIWLGAEKEELSSDLMRYLPDAPSNVMEYLLIQLMLWGKQEGYHWYNLGMAPLSGFENHTLAPLWNRFGSLVFRHGEHFFNFQRLRWYKEKFDPEWEPKYMASSGGLSLPRILANIASLISKPSKKKLLENN